MENTNLKATSVAPVRKRGSEVISSLSILGITVTIVAMLAGITYMTVGKNTAKTTLTEMTASIPTAGITITDANSIADFTKSVEKLSGGDISTAITSITLKQYVGTSLDSKYTVSILPDTVTSTETNLMATAFAKLNGVGVSTGINNGDDPSTVAVETTFDGVNVEISR